MNPQTVNSIKAYWDSRVRLRTLGMDPSDIDAHAGDLMDGKVIAQIDVEDLHLFEVLDPNTSVSVLQCINPFSK